MDNDNQRALQVALSRIMANPTGTETTQQMTSATPINEIRGMSGDRPVLQTDVDAAHATKDNASRIAMMMALGMAGGGEGRFSRRGIAQAPDAAPMAAMPPEIATPPPKGVYEGLNDYMARTGIRNSVGTPAPPPVNNAEPYQDIDQMMAAKSK